MIAAFLKILESVSFDEAIFRKEFVKTLGWVPEEDYLTIEEWMINNRISKRYPDLLELVTHNSGKM